MFVACASALVICLWLVVKLRDAENGTINNALGYEVTGRPTGNVVHVENPRWSKLWTYVNRLAFSADGILIFFPKKNRL